MYTDICGFSKYGIVLEEKGDTNQDLFVQEQAVGWKIVQVMVKERKIQEMSLHNNSPEAFFPLEGEAVLAVTEDNSENKYEEFLIDRPLLIREGIWHGLRAVSESAKVLVVENKNTNLERRPLDKEK